MADLTALTQLFAQYAYSMDNDQFELLGPVFTEDATFSVSIAGEEVLSFTGRGPVVDFIRETTHGQTDQRRHVITNLFVDPGTGTVAANLTLLVVDGGALEVKSCGVYRCTVAEEGGAPRFRTMALALDLGF